MKAKWSIYLAASLLVACGGGGGGSGSSDSPPPAPPPATSTGVFLDSPVINIGYRTATQSGVTNAQGEYSYLPGETVTFFIGDLEFPAVAASGTVTPLELAGASNTNDPIVVNMIRLLQTLDRDGNPDNGITITENAKGTATQVNFALSTTDFANSSAVLTLIQNGGQDTPALALVSETAALAHFESQLIEGGVIQQPTSIVGTWILTQRPATHIGEADLSIIVFLPNGTYYQADVNEINEGSGLEYGTYTYSNNTLSVTTTVDTNGDAGLGGGSIANIALGQNTFTFPTDDERESGNYTFTRAASDGIIGTWLVDGGTTLFVFLNDGEYIGFEPIEENGFVGIEWGPYVFANNDLQFTQAIDTSGESLASHADITTAMVEGNTLTLTEATDGDVVFARQ